MADTFTGITNYFKTMAGLIAIGLSTAAGKLHLKGTSSLASVGTTNKLTADGTFDASTGWTVGSGWSISGGKATHTSGVNALVGTLTNALGHVQQAVITTSGRTVGSVDVYIGGEDTGYTITTDKANTIYFYVPSANAALSFVPTTDFDGSIDTVVVYDMVASVPELVLENSNGSGTNVEVRAGSNEGYNVGVGRQAARFLIPEGSGPYYGINNNYFGERCGASAVKSVYVNGHGQECLLRMVEGWRVNAYGDSAFRLLPIGYDMTGFGHEVGVNLKRGTGSSFWGSWIGTGMKRADYCDLMGYETCTNVDEGYNINTHGRRTAYSNASNKLIGRRINLFGDFAGYLLEGVANDISAIGHFALGKLKSASKMAAVGDYSGYGSAASAGVNAPETDEDGLFLGFETTRSVPSSTKLTDYAAIGSKAVVDKSHQNVYGASTIEEHLFRSGKIKALGFSTYADNAAAITGGLTSGDFYKTATGELRIVV